MLIFLVEFWRLAHEFWRPLELASICIWRPSLSIARGNSDAMFLGQSSRSCGSVNKSREGAKYVDIASSMVWMKATQIKREDRSQNCSRQPAYWFLWCETSYTEKFDAKAPEDVMFQENSHLKTCFDRSQSYRLITKRFLRLACLLSCFIYVANTNPIGGRECNRARLVEKERHWVHTEGRELWSSSSVQRGRGRGVWHQVARLKWLRGKEGRESSTTLHYSWGQEHDFRTFCSEVYWSKSCCRMVPSWKKHWILHCLKVRCHCGKDDLEVSLLYNANCRGIKVSKFFRMVEQEQQLTSSFRELRASLWMWRMVSNIEICRTN